MTEADTDSQKQNWLNCKLHARFLNFKIFTSTHWASDFRPRLGYWEDHQSVRSSSSQTVAVSESRLTVKRWPSMNSPLQLTHFLPFETGLSRLRDELACTVATTWCGWSFARGTSACLRRWGSDAVASQVSLCTGCFGRHSAASSSSSSSSESQRSRESLGHPCSGRPRGSTTSHNLHLSRSSRMWDGAQVL